tara:strand:- start:3575 stop:4129 length:555 start_codon:yes stop_codon:yes gene_type:complete
MLVSDRTSKSQPSFSFKNRIYRLLWNFSYLLLIRYTPVYLRFWRVFIYKLFGAQIRGRVNIYPKAKIWSPQNLVMEDGSCIANDAIIYNQAVITLNNKCLISQGAHLCAGTHNYETETFDLITSPITVGKNAWICAEAFVCPGVNIAEGAVLGARSFAFKNLDEYCVYSGNPAIKIKKRQINCK